MNKKIIVYLLLALFIVILYLYLSSRLFSGSQSGQEQKIQEDEYPGYLPGMINIEKEAEKDIQDAVEKENARINEALKEAEMENE